MTERDGARRRGRPAVTLRDVARQAGVDVSVVSRVVNDDPSLRVAPATRTRVETAIRSLGYRPNVQARGLRLARSWTLGFVLPDLMNPFYSPIVEGAEERAAKDGYMVVIVRELGGGSERGTELSFQRLVHQGRVDGLLVASGRVDDAILRGLSAEGQPLVIVNRRVPGIPGPVIVDDGAGAYMATDHLLALGHREIGHIAGPAGVDNTDRRRSGFERAARGFGARTVVVHGDGWDPESGYRAAVRLLDTERVTAIFATNIVVATGVIGALQERGLRVPADLSVVALHDFPVARYLSPPITTVAMPLRELGRVAVEVMLARLAGAPPAEVVVAGEPELIVRGSTAPPP